MENQRSSFQKEITKEIQQMDERLKNLEEKILQVDNKISQIVEAILGNSLTKQGGFVKDLENIKMEQEQIKSRHQTLTDALHNRIDKIEKFYQRVVWTISILVGLGLFLKFGVDFYEKVQKIATHGEKIVQLY